MDDFSIKAFVGSFKRHLVQNNLPRNIGKRMGNWQNNGCLL
nr:MAG TPA: hypothetical protein [Caudoviricetes sp.]